jgi:hypothetical protein
MKSSVPWPDGKRFAFTVFDDTDAASVAKCKPLYSFLADHGFRTTKSCWVVRGDPNRGTHMGHTSEDPDFRQWNLDLQSQGFEIGWHNATWHALPRAEVRAALDKFKAIFGHDPVTGTNHCDLEGIYWGAGRVSGLQALAYNVMTRFRNRKRFRGHIEGDEYFWGDACRERIKYFRNFVFRDVNTLKSCPFMPYHDPQRPYVNWWFASSDGNHVSRYNECLSEAAQDRLEEEGGACIVYTHFACGFYENGALDRRFKELMVRLSKKNGWFAPVADVLDHLQAVGGRHVITNSQRQRLERKWLLEKLFIGTD